MRARASDYAGFRPVARRSVYRHERQSPARAAGRALPALLKARRKAGKLGLSYRYAVPEHPRNPAVTLPRHSLEYSPHYSGEY